MRKTKLVMLSMFLTLFAFTSFAILDVSAQDVDGAQEGSRDDGFDWGWLGLLGLLGLLPRKPVDEHVGGGRGDASHSPIR